MQYGERIMTFPARPARPARRFAAESHLFAEGT
jgi:hypothetical protein